MLVEKTRYAIVKTQILWVKSDMWRHSHGVIYT